MQQFPHRYTVTTSAAETGDLAVDSPDLPTLAYAAPREFEGPGDRWSPETLLVASVASCLILTFRAIARMSKLSWTSLDCEVTGILNRIDRVTQFTAFDIALRLELPPGANEEQGHRLLVKAEETCLITRSLRSEVNLDIDVKVGAAV